MRKHTKPKKDLRCHKEALGLINKPEKTTQTKQIYDRVACVFQGGGALGAYQVGAFRAIQEYGYNPNYLAGVSIGAINCAIIAGNPPHKQWEKLKEFWFTIMPKIGVDPFVNYNVLDFVHHWHNYFGAWYSLLFGLEGFFKPRPLPPNLFTYSTPDRLSFYDTSALRSTLEQVIDFNRINDKKVTLCLGAVNVTSGEMEFFNNQLITITPEHVMASGALPPGFPAIKIGENYYWDGGIYANTPLVTVLDALPQLDTLCFVVDCFSLRGTLPQTIDELSEREKDIRYASHSRRLTNVYASRQNLQIAIKYLSNYLTPAAKANPDIKEILELGHEKRFSVVHVIYKDTPYSHSFKDYNFLPSVIKFRLHMGYENTINILNNPEWEKKSTKKLDCSIYGVSADYFQQH